MGQRQWFVPALVLIACLAPMTARAGDGEGEAVRYLAEMSLRVTDGEGKSLSSRTESMPLTQRRLFVDSDANQHMRMDWGKSVLETTFEGKKMGPTSRPGWTTWPVLDEKGMLVDVIEIGGGMFLTGDDIGRPMSPGKLEEAEGGARVAKMKWPLQDGLVMPVTVRFEPGRKGGEGDSSWTEASFGFVGKTNVTQPVAGVLTLEGKGRVVVSADGMRTIALDLHITSIMREGDDVLAKADQRLGLRIDDDSWKDVPSYGLVLPEGSDEPRYAAAFGPAMPFSLAGCLLFAMGFGFVFQTRRRRWRRLELLTILVLVPAILFLGVSPDGAEASSKKDKTWGAASLVTGTIVAIPAVYTTLWAGWAFGLAVGAGSGVVAAGAITLGLGALAVGAVALAGYGGYRLWRGFKKSRNEARLASGDDASERARAAMTLGEMGDPDNTQHLVAALDDESPAVRLAAAEALGVHGDRAALPELESHLASESDEVVKAEIMRSQRLLDAIPDRPKSEGFRERLRGLFRR